MMNRCTAGKSGKRRRTGLTIASWASPNWVRCTRTLAELPGFFAEGEPVEVQAPPKKGGRLRRGR